ncbi:MAG: hypothetical protein ACRD0F_00220 [Acidimicrobiales bacterium]
MAKLTIELDDEVAKRVLDAAAERGVAAEAVAAAAVSERFAPRRRLSFIGMGHSGGAEPAGRVRELRREMADEKLAGMADERHLHEG